MLRRDRSGAAGMCVRARRGRVSNSNFTSDLMLADLQPDASGGGARRLSACFCEFCGTDVFQCGVFPCFPQIALKCVCVFVCVCVCLCVCMCVRVFAINIAGAFDKVSDRGFLRKAEALGISGELLKWIRSYLSDRKLHAVVGCRSGRG